LAERDGLESNGLRVRLIGSSFFLPGDQDIVSFYQDTSQSFIYIVQSLSLLLDNDSNLSNMSFSIMPLVP
jgi:hypothetical protein